MENKGFTIHDLFKPEKPRERLQKHGEVITHIIISENGIFSFKEKGLI